MHKGLDYLCEQFSSQERSITTAETQQMVDNVEGFFEDRGRHTLTECFKELSKEVDKLMRRVFHI